jgi:hypothetical protein
MHKIYFLEKYPTQSNAYTISRTEKWTFRNEKCFTDLEEAKEYIREKNKYTPEFVLQAENISGIAREELLDRYCFTNNYILKRRYFMDPLPIQQINNSIVQSGINLIDIPN